jgi:hypothetical protein
MMQRGFVRRPEGPWTPRRLLAFAERYCASTRKLLEVRQDRPGLSGPSWRIAAEHAHVIEKISKKGMRSPAAEATEIAEYVEQLLDLLRTEINELLDRD